MVIEETKVRQAIAAVRVSKPVTSSERAAFGVPSDVLSRIIRGVNTDLTDDLIIKGLQKSFITKPKKRARARPIPNDSVEIDQERLVELVRDGWRDMGHVAKLLRVHRMRLKAHLGEETLITLGYKLLSENVAMIVDDYQAHCVEVVAKKWHTNVSTINKIVSQWRATQTPYDIALSHVLKLSSSDKLRLLEELRLNR